MKCIAANCDSETANNNTNYCGRHQPILGKVVKVLMFDGDFVLADLQKAITYFETSYSLQIVKLTAVVDDNGREVNEASFADASEEKVGERELDLIELRFGERVSELQEEQKTKGKSVVFISSVFVLGKITEVAVVR